MTATFALRRLLLSSGLALIAASPLPSYAQAAWPNKIIKFIVPFSPGGGTDLLTREIASQLSATMGYKIVVENKQGASGMLGAEAALREPADGYTFLAITGSNVIAGIVNKRPNSDFIGAIQGVVQYARTPTVLVVGPQSDAKSMVDLLAKARRAPGAVTYGTSGIGSLGHLGGERFAALAGVKLNHIPYKGTGTVLADLMSGQIDMMLAGVSVARPLIKSGKLRLLAVAEDKRLPDFPDVPTFAESGIVGYESDLWHGLVAAKEVPPEIIRKINADINAVLKSPAMRQRFEQSGETPVGGTPEQFQQVIQKEAETSQRIIKTLDLKLQS